MNNSVADPDQLEISRNGTGRPVAAFRRDRLTVVVPVSIAVAPVLIAGMRAALGPWLPIYDNAYFTARSLDVGTEHHPLLGAWSSGSASIEESVNNVGALQLDLLAPFTRIAPMGGTAIGVAAMNVAAIITIAWMIGRAVGARYVLPTMVAISLLTSTLGSELLITPQQHQYLVLPYLCVLIAVWAIATGSRWA